jgi:nitroreductase
MTSRIAIDAEELLTTTRTVRRGLDLTRDVDLATVEDCLRIALQAPNGFNRQRWRWIVLVDPLVRARVAEIYRIAFHERHSVLLDRLDRMAPAARRTLADARDLADKLAQVPVLVLPCLELDSPRLPDGNQASLWASLLPAAWSYALAARTRGLVTAWTTVHLDREREVADLLGLPPTVHQGGLLPTAYGLRSTFHPADRRPLADVLHVDGWRAGPTGATR